MQMFSDIAQYVGLRKQMLADVVLGGCSCRVLGSHRASPQNLRISAAGGGAQPGVFASVRGLSDFCSRSRSKQPWILRCCQVQGA